MADPTDPDPDTPAGGKDVIVFYDADNKVVKVIPTKDVILIIPDRLLKKQPPEDEEQGG